MAPPYFRHITTLLKRFNKVVINIINQILTWCFTNRKCQLYPKVRLAQKNQAPAHLQVLDFHLVWMTGLEPATSWSLTRCATNCATSRRLERKCTAFFLIGKIYFHKNTIFARIKTRLWNKTRISLRYWRSLPKLDIFCWRMERRSPVWRI